MAAAGEFEWESPGPGTWTHDRSHFPRPICGFARHRRERLFAGQGRGFAGFGVGLGDMKIAIVNGWQFGQRPVLPDDDIAARESVAAATIEQRRWRQVGQDWYGTKKPAIESAVAAVLSVDPRALDDTSLASHLQRALDVQLRAADHHFEHIALFSVVGELLLACRRWEIETSDAVGLLRGSSPASAETARSLAPVVAALQRAGVRPTSLDDVRSVGAEASAALDAHLARFGPRLIGGFDFCDVTLDEVPEAVLTTILSAFDSGVDHEEAADTASDVRGAVPPSERPRFDDLVAEARYCYGIRDDDVAPLMSARGAVRRALQAVGARGPLVQPEHVFEANVDEVVAMLTGGSGPSGGVLAERAQLREQQAAADVPPFLGDPPSPPDLSGMPPSVRRLTEGFLAYGQLMFVAGRTPMRGFGVGTDVVRGRARVVHRAEEALASLEPGDILVTTMTTPAFNGVLPLAGGLVTEAGGLLSHAAIISRELGVPALIGVSGAMSSVADGDEIEIDPVSGTLTKLSAAT